MSVNSIVKFRYFQFVLDICTRVLGILLTLLEIVVQVVILYIVIITSKVYCLVGTLIAYLIILSKELHSCEMPFYELYLRLKT